jgi:2-aminoethylphosphonate-pyruvate transaminase
MKKLFTPGPLSTSDETKQAMLVDWPSRDEEFEIITRSVHEDILAVYPFGDDKACVLMQGPSTFGIEATLRTFLDKEHKLLALSNGVYGERIAKIAKQAGYQVQLVEAPFDVAIDKAFLQSLEIEVSDFDYVSCVHCETSTGVLNQLDDISDFAKQHNVPLIIDSISGFGGLPLNVQHLQFAAMIGSANKCLEGVPGFTFVVVDKQTLIGREGQCDSISFDLYDQWQYMMAKGQWRFTPPTHVVAALQQALVQLQDEGGVSRRIKRYQNNFDTLSQGMMDLQLQPLVDRSIQSPIIVAYKFPDYLNDFEQIYRDLKAQDIIIYPGSLAGFHYFRIGCIGHLNQDDVTNLLENFAVLLQEAQSTGDGS